MLRRNSAYAKQCRLGSLDFVKDLVYLKPVFATTLAENLASLLSVWKNNFEF
jgi:hypothetical protein